MKKRVLFVILSALLMLLPSSCVKEGVSPLVNGTGMGRIRLALELEESTLELRAGERPEENEVTSVRFFAFRQDGTYISQSAGTNITDSGNGTVYEVDAEIPVGEVTIWAVANAPAGFDFGTISTVDDLKETSFPQSLPAMPLIMTGSIDATVTTDSYDVIRIPVRRIASAIEIVNQDPDFVLEKGFWVLNGETMGYVDARPAPDNTLTSNLTADAVRIEDGTSLPGRAYVYPREADAATEALTAIVFKGKIGENGASSYYRLNLNVRDGRQELLPGHIYRVQVVKITEPGFADLNEAKKASADKKIVFTVSDWEDKNRTEIAFFGNYYLGVEARTFDFDYLQQSSSAKILTNVPDVVLTPAASSDNKTADGKAYRPATWTTGSVLPDSEGGKVVNVGVFEYVTEGSAVQTRRAFYYLIAQGIHTDDLKVRLDVSQVNYLDFKIDAPAFEVTPDAHYATALEAATLKSDVITNFDQQDWYVLDLTYPFGDDPFIKSIKTPNTLWTYNEGSAVKNEPSSDVKNVGNGQLEIETYTLPTRKNRIAEIVVVSGEPPNRYWYYVDVFLDFFFDYNIVYPAGVPDQMKRAKTTIETPIGQTEPLTYSVNVESNASWETYLYPEGAAEWITVSPGSYTYTNSTDASGNIANETSSFTVTVKPNDGALLSGYPPARQAVLWIRSIDRSRLDQYGQPAFYKETPIYVYQGGYVKIGENEWLDRNLKTGKLFATDGPNASRYQGHYPMLYDYASPLGLPQDNYGAYAFDNTTLGRVDVAMTLKPTDDGYFLTGYNQSCTGSDIFRNGRWIGTAGHTNYDTDWGDANTNPCPDGWRPPSEEAWNSVMDLIRNGTTYGAGGKEGVSVYGGTFGVNNSGRVIEVWPLDPNTGDVVFWFLPAAGARLINGNPILFPGVFGKYKIGSAYTGGGENSVPHLFFNSSSVLWDSDNQAAGASVRCVRKK